MIESQGDENRPPLDKIIDRRATSFRNSQFGSQFDNVDFLGLKKQEEDEVKKDLRRAQLNHYGVTNGVSTAVAAVAGMQTGASTSGYDTPAEAYESEEEGYPDHIRNLDDALKRLRDLSEQRKHVEDAHRGEQVIAPRRSSQMGDNNPRRLSPRDLPKCITETLPLNFKPRRNAKPLKRC